MSIATSGNSVSRIADWLKKKFEPVATALNDDELIETSNQRLENLRSQESRSEANYSVCLLGQAGVGKSTLLNTLVAGSEIVVPSGGGTGPLTANALKVSYSDSQQFSVTYHGREKINQLRFTLDGMIYRQVNEAAATDQDQVASDIGNAVTQESELDTDEDRKSKSEGALRNAKLLISGEQTGDRTLEYLADALRFIVGGELKYESSFQEQDISRIRRIAKALSESENAKKASFSADSTPEFRRVLRDHACGFLAPLIKEMEIAWPSEVLSGGIEIVDLPGIGIVSDVYANVTANYLRKEAQSVMLVADSRGLREEDALLLRESGFLVRLMHSLDNPDSDPVRLIIVVVKIDDVATENWRNDKNENGSALLSKKQHFEKVVESCKRDVRRQLIEYTQKVWLSAESEGNQAKEDVIARLTEGLEVYPVSAIQYRMNIEDDEDDRPFLNTPELTNIPALRDELISVAMRQKQIYEQRYVEGRKLFFDRIRSRLNTELARRENNELTPEMQAVKKEFVEITNEVNIEYSNRSGEFRNYLRSTVPGQITDKVEVAAGRAEREIRHYLNSMQTAHWGTLRAAVRRSGSFQGARNINLPQDFALRFEEPLAEIWSNEILQGLRSETKKFVKFRAESMAKIDAWAQQKEITPPPLLEALLVDLGTEQQELESSETDAVEDLRSHVRKSLQEKIEEPIREQCVKFVESQQDVGMGVKSRILGLFDELASIAVDAAKSPAHDLLTEQFKIAEQKLLKDVKENQNPIEQIQGAFNDSSSELFVEKGPTVIEIQSVIDSMPTNNSQDNAANETGQI